ncbi:MAG: ABC transporter ATP-binding protein [Cellulosilyticum sp.]|nr:ABC transporter ATP-binding protein [Cellulosilyticum sp.]
MSSIILRTEKLCKSFSNHGIQQHVLKNMDIEIMEEDFTIIMGASGSGKSTLLYALSGMDSPTLGKIYFGEEEISKYTNDELALFRRKHCGFVFQNIYLLENMSVFDNILTGALVIQKNSKELIQKVKSLLKQVGLEENIWSKFPNQLSGGESQRVGIVRAIINSPEIVFADEPTGALNSASSIDVLDIFSKVNREGQSVVMVTHDLKTALRGNRIIYLKDGCIAGEVRLEPFSEKNMTARRNKLQGFLDEMGW